MDFDISQKIVTEPPSRYAASVMHPKKATRPFYTRVEKLEVFLTQKNFQPNNKTP